MISSFNLNHLLSAQWQMAVNWLTLDNYINANHVKPNEEMFGVGKGKNLIVVSLESMQSFVINNDMNGEVVTPFLK